MNENKNEFIYELVDGFCDKVREEIFGHIKNIQINLMEPSIHSVFSALLARQGTLAMELSKAVSAWNYHSAPLFIRAMVDVHITAAWLMGDPQDRCKKYVEHGLGQEKLLCEHFKAQLTAQGKNPDEDENIKKLEAWINAQKYTFLLPVELGAWSGKSTREMAIECGLQDAYNFSFQTFSSCVHSTWNHIARYNAQPSESPLHRYTFIADMPELRPDIHQLDTVARRLDETLSLYQKFLKMPEKVHSLEEWLDQRLDELSEKYKDQTEKKES